MVGSANRWLLILVGAILAGPAALKAWDVSTSPTPETGWLTSRWFLIVLVELELVTAMALLSSILPGVAFYPRLTWTGALLLFTAFTLTNAWKVLSGSSASCGCFGVLERVLPIHAGHALCLDLIGISALLVARPWIAPSAQWCSAWSLRHAWVCALVLAIGMPTGTLMASYRPGVLRSDGALVGESRYVVFQPEEWVGQYLPLLRHIDLGERLSKGRWTIVLYRDDCALCRESIPIYLARAANTRLVLVRVPRGRNAGRDEGRIPPSLTTGQLSDLHDWVLPVPCELEVHDGELLELTGTVPLT